MGAKIEFRFLVNGKIEEVLMKAYGALLQCNWRYNGCVLGEYSYWLDGPIWLLG